MSDTDKIKWIHAIANKNDIGKETWHEYMLCKHGKASVTELDDKELDDVLKYVCDSRLFTFEKQIYLIMKMAEEIGMTKHTLDTMSSKFGAHDMEELDDAGIRGMISIVSSMIDRKKREAATVNAGETITIRTPETVIYSDTSYFKLRVYTPRDGYIAIYDADYYLHDVKEIADEKIEKKCKVNGQTVLMMSNPIWSFLVMNTIKYTEYRYKNKMIAIIISAK